MTQEAYDTLQKTITTLVQKVQDRDTEIAAFKARVAELVAENEAKQLRIDSLSDSVLMVNEMLDDAVQRLMHKDNEIAEANQEISSLKNEVAQIRSEAA